MIRRPPRSTLSSSSAASDVYKRQPPAAAGHQGDPPGQHRPGRPSPGLRSHGAHPVSRLRFTDGLDQAVHAQTVPDQTGLDQAVPDQAVPDQAVPDQTVEVSVDIGFAIPISGSWATPENQLRIVRRAEELGYAQLWTFQRLLVPLDEAGAPTWAPQYRSVHDPLVTLGWLAGLTTGIRLGVALIHISEPTT